MRYLSLIFDTLVYERDEKEHIFIQTVRLYFNVLKKNLDIKCMRRETDLIYCNQEKPF